MFSAMISKYMTTNMMIPIRLYIHESIDHKHNLPANIALARLPELVKTTYANISLLPSPSTSSYKVPPLAYSRPDAPRCLVLCWRECPSTTLDPGSSGVGCRSADDPGRVSFLHQQVPLWLTVYKLINWSSAAPSVFLDPEVAQLAPLSLFHLCVSFHAHQLARFQGCKVGELKRKCQVVVPPLVSSHVILPTFRTSRRCF